MIHPGRCPKMFPVGGVPNLDWQYYRLQRLRQLEAVWRTGFRLIATDVAVRSTKTFRARGLGLETRSLQLFSTVDRLATKGPVSVRPHADGKNQTSASR